ncbi:MAG: hypothetical protein RL150_453 [Candidatus Parcubacteria bacterium]|jgi:hypothetical protein
MFFRKYKIAIIVIGVALVGLVVYSFMTGAPTDDVALVTTPEETEAALVGNEIITALNQVNTLRLSKDIFSNPVYLSLIDRSQVIPEEKVGKVNPFDPIGSSVPVRAGDVPEIREVQSTPKQNTIVPNAQSSI